MLSERINSERKFVNAVVGEASVANSCSLALDGSANLGAYRCPTTRRRNSPAHVRTKPVLRSRSHIVAKGAAALPFNRPCDWSCMCTMERGPRYLTKPDYLGTIRMAGNT